MQVYNAIYDIHFLHAKLFNDNYISYTNTNLKKLSSQNFFMIKCVQKSYAYCILTLKKIYYYTVVEEVVDRYFALNIEQ